MEGKWEKGTICIQGGYTPKAGEPRVLPIFQSATYNSGNSRSLRKFI